MGRAGRAGEAWIILETDAAAQGAALAAESCADGRDDRRHCGAAAGERIAVVRGVLDLVAVRAVDVEETSGPAAGSSAGTDPRRDGQRARQ